jgi:predicted GIY-YIG superfamily endonuclease
MEYNIYTIYSITCIDEKVKGIYVGITKDFADRQKDHKGDSIDETTKHRKVYKSIHDNSGWDNLKFTCLEILTCKKKGSPY